MVGNIKVAIAAQQAGAIFIRVCVNVMQYLCVYVYVCMHERYSVFDDDTRYLLRCRRLMDSRQQV